ncbi:MAG TPA: hypothetical protein VIK28_01565 [Sedimentisphaerales bacterium]
MLAEKGQKVFTCALQGMVAIFAFHTGKVVVQIAAIEIPVNYMPDVRPPEVASF